MLAKAFKSKMIWFGIVIAVLSVLQGYVHLLPLTPVHQMIVGLVISVGIVILRFVTTTAIKDK